MHSRKRCLTRARSSQENRLGNYHMSSGACEPSRALHGNTPFFMVYGSDAVLPADLIFRAPRLTFKSIAEAEVTRLEDIDILEEERLNVSRPDTSRPCGAITTKQCGIDPSQWEIWSSAEYWREKDGTNCHHHGKDHSLSQRLPDQDPTGSLKWMAPKWGILGILSTQEILSITMPQNSWGRVALCKQRASLSIKLPCSKAYKFLINMLTIPY
jgi:hypothetical protein